MDILLILVIIALILGFFLLGVPISIVHYTELEKDDDHPVNITRKYTDKIGWGSAQHQFFAPFYSWASLCLLVPGSAQHPIEYYVIIFMVFLASLYWFWHCFKGYFFSSSLMRDNPLVILFILIAILIPYALDFLGSFVAIFLGMIMCVWWGGRLFMYKAIANQAIQKTE